MAKGLPLSLVCATSGCEWGGGQVAMADWGTLKASGKVASEQPSCKLPTSC
jgi:hypothetical protein